MNTKKKIAIACQGGGSHAAYTAGVLKKLLREDILNSVEVTGISGTSGGAICAFLLWYGLITDGKEGAVKLLGSFWEKISANIWDGDLFLNNFMVGVNLMSQYISLPKINPAFTSFWGQNKMRSILRELVDPTVLKQISEDSPILLRIGAIDVLNGEFKVFNQEDIDIERVIASTAMPTIYKSVQVDGRPYWDGYFSQNPPVKGFTEVSEGFKPDEIWIIQINPKEKESEPFTMQEITDRINELSGNISLMKEINYLKKLNEFVQLDKENGGHLFNGKYKVTDIYGINLTAELSSESKLDRNPWFIDFLINHGEERAAMFIDSPEQFSF